MKFKTRTHKFNAQPVVIDGIRFPSKGHAAFDGSLVLDLKAGKIDGFEREVPFILPAKIKFILDYVITDIDKQKYHVDFKGYQTDVYKIKKKLVEYFYGIKIIEVSATCYDFRRLAKL